MGRVCTPDHPETDNFTDESFDLPVKSLQERRWVNHPVFCVYFTLRQIPAETQKIDIFNNLTGITMVRN